MWHKSALELTRKLCFCGFIDYENFIWSEFSLKKLIAVLCYDLEHLLDASLLGLISEVAFLFLYLPHIDYFLNAKDASAGACLLVS